MKKIWKIVLICTLLGVIIWTGSVLRDRQTLSRDIIRLHVVANSDSAEDQALKLQVKDAIVGQLQGTMQEFTSVEEAKRYLEGQTAYVTNLANDVLQQSGSCDRVCVTLTQECFPQREYETFSLPAGVYESLRVSIGNAQGRNWWCVVFPTLCAGTTSQEFADTAAGSGFNQSLTGALEQDSHYEIRFFLLDCLGKIQNFFYRD